MKQIVASEWLEFAGTYKDKIVREIGCLAAPLFTHRDQLVHEAKSNLDHLLQNLRQSALSLFSIPTHRDLSKLQRKLTRIESRLNAMDKTDKFPPAHV